jgi:drug/metabolite transporter (DMT)-like permease
MKMAYQLILLLLAYLFFSLEPLYLSSLQGVSVFSIVFYRYITTAVVEYITSVIIVIAMKKELAIRGINKKNGEIWKETITNYYKAPISNFLGGQSQLLFFVILGMIFGSIMGPFYFLSFSTVGVVITTVAVNCIALLLVAILNALKKEEEIDLLKVIYLGLLVTGTILIGISRPVEEIAEITSGDVLILGVAITCITLFLTAYGKQPRHKIALFKDFRIPMLENAKRMDELGLSLRAMYKNGAIHLFGAISIIPFTGLLYLISPSSLLGSIAGQFILRDLWHPEIFFRTSAIILLILLGTVAPYFCLAISSATWPKSALRYEMWGSIFKIFEPLIGLFIGLWVWQETLRIDYVIITSILLIAVLLIRYFDDTANIRRVVFFITLNPGGMKKTMDYLTGIKEITKVWVLGDNMIFAAATVRSSSRITVLNTKFDNLPETKCSEYNIASSLIFRRNVDDRVDEKEMKAKIKEFVGENIAD